MDVTALYRRSHSHLRARTRGSSSTRDRRPLAGLMRFPTSAGDLILDAIELAALRAARSSASGNGRSPVAKQHHLAITQ